MNVAIPKAIGIQCQSPTTKWKARQQRIILGSCSAMYEASMEPQTKALPFLKVKLPEPVEAKPAVFFSVCGQVEQHSAPSLQLTQNYDDSWQTNLFCTSLSPVDVESFSSNFCFHHMNCFCIILIQFSLNMLILSSSQLALG